MPKPNYGFEKRQRELEKKRKKEEKAHRKTSGTDEPEQPPAVDAENNPAPQPTQSGPA